MGVSANLLTYCGLASAFVSGRLALSGEFFPAGCWLLFSGFLDLLDGAVARVSGKAKPFGGILDSTLDRYGDAFVLGGVLFYCTRELLYPLAFFAFSALLGSFGISYVRARAECEIEDCRVGFWERGERLVYLALGMLTGGLAVSLCVLGTATHWTLFQRLAYARFYGAHPGAAAPFFLKSAPRTSAAYAFKVSFLIALVLFWQPVFRR